MIEELCGEGTFYFDSWVLEEGNLMCGKPVIVGEVADASLGQDLVGVIDGYCDLVVQ